MPCLTYVGREGIGFYKTKMIRHWGPWKGVEDIELATLEWVWRFNHHRLFGPIRDIPPVEREETYCHHGSEADATGAVLT